LHEKELLACGPDLPIGIVPAWSLPARQFNGEDTLKWLMLLPIVLVSILPGAGCKLPLSSIGEPDRYLVTQAEITLGWDPSSGEVVSYRLYYRNHGAEEWAFVAEVPSSDSAECTIAHSSIGNGDFDFGVVAVNAAAIQSPMHSSLDTTAYPVSWYLHWELP
jgi:hypothetical protein